jgi:hypothetical protein
MDFTIYTPGDPQTMAGALRAVVMTLGTSGGLNGSMLADMIKVGMVGAILMALFSALRNKGFPRLDHLMAYFIATIVLMTPTGTVTVESSYSGNALVRGTYAPQVVDDVPLLVAAPLALGTTVGREIGDRLASAMSPTWLGEFCGVNTDGVAQHEGRCSVWATYSEAIKAVTDILISSSQDPRDSFHYNVTIFHRFCDPEKSMDDAMANMRRSGYEIYNSFCNAMSPSVKDLIVLTKGPNSKIDTTGAIRNAIPKTCAQMCTEIRDMFQSAHENGAEGTIFANLNCTFNAGGNARSCADSLQGAMEALLAGISGQARAQWNQALSQAAFACYMGNNANRSVVDTILSRTTAGEVGGDVCNSTVESIRSSLAAAQKAAQEANARSVNWIVMATVIMPFMLAAMIFTGYERMGRTLVTFGGYVAFLAVPEVINVTGEMIIANQVDRFINAINDYRNESGLSLSSSCVAGQVCAMDLFAYFREITNAIMAYAETARNGAWGLIALAGLLGITSMGGGGAAGGGGGGEASAAGGSGGSGIRTDIAGYSASLAAAQARGFSGGLAASSGLSETIGDPQNGGKTWSATSMFSMGGLLMTQAEQAAYAEAGGSVSGFLSRTAAANPLGMSFSANQGSGTSSGVQVGVGASTATMAQKQQMTALQQAQQLTEGFLRATEGSKTRESGLTKTNNAGFNVQTSNSEYSAQDVKGGLEYLDLISGRIGAGGSINSGALANSLLNAAANARTPGIAAFLRRLAGGVLNAFGANANISGQALEQFKESFEKSISSGTSQNKDKSVHYGSEISGTVSNNNAYSEQAQKTKAFNIEDVAQAAKQDLYQQQSQLQQNAMLQGGYQDTTGMQMGFNFAPFTFSPQGAASHMLHRLRQDGSLRTAFANSLLQGGFEIEDVHRALENYDNRMARDPGFAVNKALSSMSLALSDIGASTNPRDRALASQGLMAISGFYDQARQFRQQMNAMFGEHDNKRAQVDGQATETFGNASAAVEEGKQTTAKATANLKTPEQIAAAGQALANEVVGLINKNRAAAGRNPLSAEQAQAIANDFKAMLGLKDPSKVTPESFQQFVGANKKEVLGLGSEAFQWLANLADQNRDFAAAAAAASPLAIGVAQTALGALLDKAAEGAGKVGSALRGKIADLAARYGSAVATAARVGGTAARLASGPVGWAALGLSLAYELNSQAKELTGKSPVEQMMSGDFKGAMQTVQEALEKSGFTKVAPENPSAPPMSSELPQNVGWGQDGNPALAQTSTPAETPALVAAAGGAGATETNFGIIRDGWGSGGGVGRYNAVAADTTEQVRVPAALSEGSNVSATPGMPGVPATMVAGIAPVDVVRRPPPPVA